MDIYKHRQQRLLALIEERFGGLRRALAEASGWSEARISQMLSTTYREGRVFSEKIARKLEEDLGLTFRYFDAGISPDYIVPQYNFSNEKNIVFSDGDNNEDFVQIKKVKLRLSAGIMGFQTEPDHGDNDTVMLLRKWVQGRAYTPEKLVAVSVMGDSMEPGLCDGDVVIVNTADTKLVDGAVYAVNYEGEAVIKRLSRDIGEWWLTSDNPDQRKYHRKMCRGGECIIVGRIVRKESERI